MLPASRQRARSRDTRWRVRRPFVNYDPRACNPICLFTCFSFFSAVSCLGGVLFYQLQFGHGFWNNTYVTGYNEIIEKLKTQSFDTVCDYKPDRVLTLYGILSVYFPGIVFLLYELGLPLTNLFLFTLISPDILCAFLRCFSDRYASVHKNKSDAAYNPGLIIRSSALFLSMALYFSPFFIAEGVGDQRKFGVVEACNRARYSMNYSQMDKIETSLMPFSLAIVAHMFFLLTALGIGSQEWQYYTRLPLGSAFQSVTVGRWVEPEDSSEDETIGAPR